MGVQNGGYQQSQEIEKLAQPDDITKSNLEAWYMDQEKTDQRLPHRLSPNKACSLNTLKDLGVIYWKLDAGNYKNDKKYQAIRKARGYSYEDLITVHPSTLPEYEKKLKMFFEEHIHTDEEIRFCVEGNGYFDVRDLDDKWIRIQMNKDDMIVLPAGIYHRFTLDDKNYIKALRLFVGEPVWTPLNRPQDNHIVRKEYLNNFQEISV